MKECCIDDIREDLIAFFKNNSIIPLLGSGFTVGSPCFNGIVPSGSQYKKYMLDKLFEKESFSPDEKKQIENYSFSNLCSIYELSEKISENDKRSYFKDNFSDVSIDSVREKLLGIDWPYIYTLNIDDAIERQGRYATTILSNQEYDERRLAEKKCVIKLHGDIGEYLAYKKSRSRVFTSDEYAKSITENKSLLAKLKSDCKSMNLLIIGCSLEDEFDLLSLQDIPVAETSELVNTRKIIFRKGPVGNLDRFNYRRFNITDVVCFDDFDKIYDSLYDIWQESLLIKNDDLDKYRGISIHTMSAEEKHSEYFYYGKNLIDYKKCVVNIPCYMVHRNELGKVNSNLDKFVLHLIKGGRVSGRSYFLIDIFRSNKSSKVYIFDSVSKLSEKALDKLLNEKNTIQLYDISALSREQFEFIITNLEKIHKKQNNIVIAISRNYSDLFGIVKYRLSKGFIDKKYIYEYDIDNRFSNDENKELNDKLGTVGFPAFHYGKTIIDNLVNAEVSFSKKGRFTNLTVKNPSVKELALLIMLATKNKVSFYDILNFGFEHEMFVCLDKYNPMIEEESVCNFEKDSADISQKKYVLNARLWLVIQLSRYAANDSNIDNITAAYSYIIENIIYRISNEYKQRRLCRDFILYDLINDIFLNKGTGHMYLIVKIYDALNKYLPNDFHFLHQYAKCYLRYSYGERDKEKIEELLKFALEKISLAYQRVCVDYEVSRNEYLKISKDHIAFTKAVISCKTCMTNQYTDSKMLQFALESLHIALQLDANYNDDLDDSNDSAVLIQFVKDVSCEYKLSLDDLQDDTYRHYFSDIRNMMIGKVNQKNNLAANRVTS